MMPLDPGRTGYRGGAGGGRYHPPAVRIVVVSAHFPPNFVSGGTLAPQRQAQGLRAAGHEVSVYAGWLGDRTPLESWTEDVDGLPVRWIVSTPWIGWSD